MAFHNYEYLEPTKEEVEASAEIADKYLEESNKEEQEWFIKQEQELLKQLMNDFQLEEFVGSTAYIINIL